MDPFHLQENFKTTYIREDSIPPLEQGSHLKGTYLFFRGIHAQAHPPVVKRLGRDMCLLYASTQIKLVFFMLLPFIMFFSSFAVVHDEVLCMAGKTLILKEIFSYFLGMPVSLDASFLS